MDVPKMVKVAMLSAPREAQDPSTGNWLRLEPRDKDLRLSINGMPGGLDCLGHVFVTPELYEGLMDVAADALAEKN